MSSTPGPADLSRRAARALRRWPPAYRAAAAVWTSLNDRLPPRTVAGIPGRVHRNDLMLASRTPEAAQSYAEAGTRAVEHIEAALGAVGQSLDGCERLLDLGCGHGRVLRWLVRAMDPAAVVVCDIDPAAVAYCSREFGVEGFVCTTDPHSITAEDLDVVWLGSVVTHLDPDGVGELFDVVADRLRPGGVAVFTTLAPSVLEWLSGEPWVLERRTELVEAAGRGDIAYAPYPQSTDGRYGLTFMQPETIDRVAARRGLARVALDPGGWLGQDVHAMVRSAR